MSLRERLQRAFEDPTTSAFRSVNVFLVLATLGAIGVAILQTEAWAEPYAVHLEVAERVLAAIFASEYILRLFSTPKPWRYAKSFYGLVDLLSFLPTYVTFGNLTFLKASRAVRVLRFLRLARLAKVAQIEQASFKAVADSDRQVVAQNIRLYVASLFAAVVVLGSLANFVEPQTFPGAIEGCVWAMSSLMGGAAFASQQPTTGGGQAVDLLARFVGMILLGFLINLVANTVNRIILGKRQRVESIR